MLGYVAPVEATKRSRKVMVAQIKEMFEVTKEIKQKNLKVILYLFIVHIDYQR